MPDLSRRFRFSALSVATLVAVCSAPAFADVAVTLNGQPLQLSPPPIERAGRVFVPLRGIFEGLGASVVYQGGQINATGGNRTVSLQIGSTQATVNGQTQALDVAPFIVGASTYVPLRFVSQALGASVNFDGAHDLVAIYNGGGNNGPHNAPPVANNYPPQQPQQQPPQGPPQQGDDITNLRPGRDETITSTRPAIRAGFAQPVDTGSVHVYLDDRDVSNEAYLNPTQVDFTPPYNLPTGRHEVRITGTAQGGGSFERRWSFTTADASQAPVNNFLNQLSPPEGAQVGQTFHLHGVTLPNARVHIVAKGAGATLGGIFRVSEGDTYATDVTADGAGRFDAEISVQNQPGASVVIAMQSVSPSGQAIAKRLQLQTH
jgi:hypothetical protein